MTRFFIDSQGNYLGGFDGALPPVGAIEIESPPVHGLDKFINGEWVKTIAPAKTTAEKLAAIGLTVAELKSELAK